MRRLLTVLLISVLGSAGAADIDCPTVHFNESGLLTYREVEVFPNPVKRHELRLDTQTRPLQTTVCDVTVTAQPGQYSIRAKDTATLVRVMGDVRGWQLLIVGEQTAGGKTTYREAATVTIALGDGLFDHTVHIDGSHGAGFYLPPDALMAVRMDSGKLLPLLFNGTFRKIDVAPASTSLTLFIKSSRPVHWEKLVLDVKRNQMTFYRRAPFPSR